jgi:hypothetical protein
MFKTSVFAFLLFTSPAFADAIDGDWCSAKGTRLTIRGPAISTPTGVSMTGQYSRHQFVYTAPAGDPDAGLEIFLDLLNEHEANYYRLKDGVPSEAELWTRCEVTSS